MAKKNGVKAITCEMCGSNDIVKQDGMYVCQFCNTKYSVEEARKLMVEGTVKIDGPVEVRGTLTLEKMVQNGETFLKLEKFDDALRVFTEITEKYPEDYRGWWGKARVYSNNLTSSIDDKSLVDQTKAYSFDDVAKENDYVTNEQFYDAWQTALAVAPKGKAYDEVNTKGKEYLNSHRKNNCKKIIDGLLDNEESVSLVELQIDNEKLHRKTIIGIVILSILGIAGVAFLALAIVKLIVRVIVERDLAGIWVVLLFAFLAYIVFSIVSGSASEIRSAEIEYRRVDEMAKKIEFHQNNLKKIQ